MSLEDWLERSRREVELAREEIAATRASAVAYLVHLAKHGATTDQIPAQPVLLRIENELGWGPYTHQTGAPKTAENLNLRWGVLRAEHLALIMGQLGTLCLRERGFSIAAYVAEHAEKGAGHELTFDLSASLRLGEIDPGQYDASGDALAFPGSSAGLMLLVEGWQKTGEQRGSVLGGTYIDGNGATWYLKWPDSPFAALSEALASALYREAGVMVPDLRLAIDSGRLGVCSRFDPDLRHVGPTGADYRAWPGFVVDCWLANWDVVGAGFGNLMTGPQGLVRIDVGGSLEFRALGTHKVFGPDVTELQTMLDPRVNHSASMVFRGIDQAAIADGICRVASVTPDRIRELVEQYCLGTALAETLIGRRAFLMGAA